MSRKSGDFVSEEISGRYQQYFPFISPLAEIRTVRDFENSRNLKFLHLLTYAV